MQAFSPDPQILLKLITQTMPYGKYKGIPYYKLPVNYLEWMARQGFPKHSGGMLLSTLYEIKLNGLEFILLQLKKELDEGRIPMIPANKKNNQ